MELRQEIGVRQLQTISPQFILSQRILQLTTLELRNEILQELTENPALEMEEVLTCPHCQRPLEGSRCEHCGRKLNEEPEKTEEDFIREQVMDYDPDEAVYSGAVSNDEERPSFLDFYQTEGHFHDILLNNFYTADYPGDLRELGEYLIYSINDDGFLKMDRDHVRERFAVTDEQIDSVVRVIQTLDPPGIGAETPQQALLIQMNSLDAEGVRHPLARKIISEHFELLGHNRLAEIAAAERVSIADVTRALDFIRRNLTPYPGRALIRDPAEPIQIARPSMEIKYNGKKLSFEILELNDFRLRINSYYADSYRKYRRGLRDVSSGEVQHIREYFKRARFFLDSIRSRRDTLEKIAQALIDEQTDFLIKGLPHFNSDITQTRLAEKIGLHESTVSRAMSQKFVRIPSGEILSFDFFFDSSVRPKEYIRYFIGGEDTERPLSDSDLQHLLENKGINLARRTVAKYREEMAIPSSYHRKRARHP